MAEEEMVFQLLEEDRKARLERIVEERKITTDDCLVLGILRLHREIGGLHREIGGLHREIEGLHGEIGRLDRRIDVINKRIDSNFRWTISLILGMWVSMIALLIPILLKLA